MAELISTFIDFSQLSAELTFTPCSGIDDLLLDNADSRMILLIKNTNALGATVTIKKGDGILSPLGDIIIPVSSGKTVAVPFSRVESARVKLITGDSKGKVLIESSIDGEGSITDISLAVLSIA